MTMFGLLAAAMALATAAWLTRPFWAHRGPRRPGSAAAVALFVCGLAAAGYARVGAPQRLADGPGAAAAPTAPQVAAMADRLADRLKRHPDDAEGWQVVARSYTRLGRHAQAVVAFRKAAQLRPDDAGLLVDFALALATSHQRRFEGEPRSLIERALRLDAKHPKALALAGAVAFERQDYRAAVVHWEALAQVETADSPAAAEIRQSIAQARQLAGMSEGAGAAGR